MEEMESCSWTETLLLRTHILEGLLKGLLNRLFAALPMPRNGACLAG